MVAPIEWHDTFTDYEIYRRLGVTKLVEGRKDGGRWSSIRAGDVIVARYGESHWKRLDVLAVRRYAGPDALGKYLDCECWRAVMPHLPDRRAVEEAYRNLWPGVDLDACGLIAIQLRPVLE